VSQYATNVRAEFVGEGAGGSKVDLVRDRPGAFYYYVEHDEDGKEVGIIHSCPCGCGMLGSLPLLPHEGRPCWSNTGPREVPTLSPSVGIRPILNLEWPEYAKAGPDGFHWHGWLRNGVWVSV
jgi:hypothetical protein